ncbi:MAG: hypothetical protein J0L62_16010 [Bacteroidetes bacterium]|nr:hypothetical protein [Bacteroidota bacterium]
MHLTLITFICLFGFSAFSQPLGHITYTVNENLPSNFTKSIVQDQDGLIWLATDGGLVRFDGEQMVLYARDLPSLLVKSVLDVPGEGIYVLTDRGLCLVTRSGLGWKTTIVIPGSDPWTDHTLHFAKTLYRDKNGLLWLGESDAIVSWDGKKLTRYLVVPKYNNDSFSRSFAFFEDSNGSLYAATWGGFLLRFDPSLKNFTEIPLEINEPVHRFYAVTKVGENKFWLGTKFGIYELNTKSDTTLRQIKKISDIPGVNALAWDGNKTVWAGTLNDGLFRLDLTGEIPKSDKIYEMGKATITGLFLDHEGRVWVTSDEGVHLLYNQFFTVRFGDRESLVIRSVKETPDRKVLVTDFNNLVLLDPKAPEEASTYLIRNSDINLLDAVSADDGVTWISFRNGELRKLSQGKAETIIHGNETQRLNLLTLDSKNNLWGREEQTRSVYRINSQGHTRVYGVPEGVVSSINAIRKLDDGSLLLTGNGIKTCIFKWNEAINAFDNISPELKTLFRGTIEVYDIEQGFDGTLILATNDGIYRVKNRIATKEFPTNPELQVVVRSLRKSSNGWIWGGSEKGLLVFTGNEWLDLSGLKGSPSTPLINHGLIVLDSSQVLMATTRQVVSIQFPMTFRTTFKPIIKSLSVNGIDDFEKIYTGSAVEIHFHSPVFPDEPVSYQYRISGIHQDWANLGQQSQILLSGLEAGKYKVEFRAQKAAAVWSDISSISFEIQSPYYLSFAAKIIYFLLFGLLFWAVISFSFKIRTQNLQNRQAELEKLVTERTSELLAEKSRTESAFISLQEKERELQTSLAELTQANSVKTDIISMASHELRNPLQSIIGFADLLKEKAENAQDDERISRIRQSAQRMLKLVNSLVDSQVLETGNQKLSFSTLNIADVVQSVILQNYPQSERKNQAVFFDPPDENCSVKADENALREIIDNILNNAIKYSPFGSVIRVKITPFPDWVRFSVTDQGPGLNSDDLKHLFEKFRKLSAKPTGGELSTGLGLSIVKKLTELHQATVWAESVPGSGATFHVEFPRHFPMD